MKRKPIGFRAPKRSMPPKDNSTPPMRKGEQILLKGQGGFRKHPGLGWKVVHLFLTDQRVIAYQVTSVMLEVALDSIIGLKEGRFYYAMKDRDALHVSYETGSGKAGFWFILNNIKEWREKIHQVALLKIDAATIKEIAAQLDSDSREILWYLWENRHAKINRLGDLIDAPSHMHVLLLIRETINPVSQKVVGSPILSFERSKNDPETGEGIFFSWWLVGQRERCVPSEERMLDIFDEGPRIQIIMEVRRIDISDIRLDLNKDRLMIRSHILGASLREKISLPAEVTLDNHQMSLKNNLLEIRLFKVGMSNSKCRMSNDSLD